MDGWITIGTKIDTKSFDAQIDYIQQRMQNIEETLEQADLGFEVGDTAKLEAEYEKLGNQLTTLIKKQKELDNEGFTGLKQSVNNVGDGLNKTIKSVSKWALAIFGIRSAYLGIRQAISYVSQYNEDMANKIESIKFTLATAIEPILTRIVNLFYTLVQYAGYLIKAWTGKDIFANSNKSLKGANKNAKELKKTMAGFDTANVLSDTSSSSSSGGGGVGTITPLEDAKIPSWLEWIKDNGDLVADIIGGITGALIALKLGLSGLLGLGIGLALVGIINTIKSILAFIKEPTWDNFANVLKNLSVVIAGVAIAMIAVNAANPLGWIALAIAAVVAITAIIIKNWDTIKGVFSKVGDFFKSVFTSAYNAITGVFSKIGSFFSGVWNKIKSIFSSIGSAIGNAFKSAFVSVINAVLKAAESVLNSPINAINKLLNKVNELPGVNLKKLSTISLPRLATGGIVNNPGRGVPIGGAIAGEAGREGVLPLTDSNTMAQLGQEIGKWISVNVDLTTKLDSRVLSRSLEQVQKNNSFIRNGVR